MKATSRDFWPCVASLITVVVVGVFCFIGSVVVESSAPSNTGSYAKQETMRPYRAQIEKRGRPVGGAAMRASLLKENNEETMGGNGHFHISEPTKNSNHGAINYYLSTEAFIDTVASCLTDVNCRIIYHHVGKSGGTTIEDTFFSLYPPYLKSCCGSKILGKLATNIESRETYCAAKFSSYQIKGDHVEGLVKSCMLVNNNITEVSPKNDKNKSRTVLLTSFREPIQRCLSSINQLCNKNEHGRSNATLMACRACRFDVGTAVWMKTINMTLNHYDGVALVTRLRLENVQVLSLDMLDINSFFDRLREKLKPNGINVPETKWRNPEKKSTCSFQMPSEMMKALAPAGAIYRDLTAGVLHRCCENQD